VQPAPASAKEYIDLVDEAIYEMQELARCAQDDMDDELSDLVPTFNAMEHALVSLRQGRDSDTGVNEDLAFMCLARTYRRIIPFFSVLDRINRAHRSGLSITEAHRQG